MSFPAYLIGLKDCRCCCEANPVKANTGRRRHQVKRAVALASASITGGISLAAKGFVWHKGIGHNADCQTNPLMSCPAFSALAQTIRPPTSPPARPPAALRSSWLQLRGRHRHSVTSQTLQPVGGDSTASVRLGLCAGL